MYGYIAGYYRGLAVGLTVVGLMLAGVVPAHAKSVHVLHVFLAAGQSNMSGRGLPIGGPGDAADPRIFQYGAKLRTLRSATVPLDMHDTATGLSPMTTMAREYLKTQPDDVGVLIIPAAHGQTGFTSAPAKLTWTVGAATAPEFDLSTLAVKQSLEGMAAARAAGYNVELKGVLWHQGENNSTMSTAGYSAKLDQLIAFFRARLAAPKLPFVIGLMSPEGIAAVPGRSNVDRSQQGTPARVPYTGLASSKAGGVYLGDFTHLSRSGVEYLGRSYLAGYWRAARNATIPLGGPTPVIRGTATIPLGGPTPVIRGTATIGAVLTVVPGVWGPGQITLSYQWYRSHVAIIGANGPAYTPGAAGLGRTLSVKVTGSRPGHADASRTSASTTKVARGPLMPSDTRGSAPGPPLISR